MADLLNNKVVLGDGTVLIDLTADTIEAEDLAAGKTAHDRTGAIITGTNTNDADTSDADALASEMLAGKTAYVNGAKVTGTMPAQGAIEGEITAVDQEYIIPAGYHDGSGKVTIDAVEQAKIIPSNIKAGIEVLGVTGEYGGGSIEVQSKEVDPGFESQTVLPDAGYDYLSQVTVNAINVTYTENAQGGNTVTVG